MLKRILLHNGQCLNGLNIVSPYKITLFVRTDKTAWLIFWYNLLLLVANTWMQPPSVDHGLERFVQTTQWDLWGYKDCCLLFLICPTNERIPSCRKPKHSSDDKYIYVAIYFELHRSSTGHTSIHFSIKLDLYTEFSDLAVPGSTSTRVCL